MMLLNIVVFLPYASRDEHTRPPKRTRRGVFESEENHIFSVERCISMDTIHFDLAELTNY